MEWYSFNPTSFRSFITRSCCSARVMFQLMTMGSAMISLTRMRGFSELHGSWNTACTELRYDFLAAAVELWTSWPSKRIDPSVGSSSISIIFAVVLLPQPDSPTTPRVSPARSSKEMSSTALMWPVTLEINSPLVTGNHFLRC